MEVPGYIALLRWTIKSTYARILACQPQAIDGPFNFYAEIIGKYIESPLGDRLANTVATLASQGLLNNDAAAMAFHADADAEFSHFIAVTHDFV